VNTLTEPVTLSVIVPTYNRVGYIRECLTALKHSGVPDLEVIVADDGSTDDTQQVTRDTTRDAHYLWMPNSGTPAVPRNRGFAISHGRYVGFLDCDDAWLPDAPARAVRLLDAYPDVDVLFAEARMGNPAEGFRSWIEVAGQDDFLQLPARWPEPGFRIFERQPFFRRMAVRNPVFIGAVIMRREAFERSSGFDPELCGAADWELWLRMAHRMTFGFMADPLAVYTRHLDNMSANHDKMIGEFGLALRKVRARCRLDRGDRAFVTAQLHHHLFSHAYLAYEAGDYALAGKRFQQAMLAGAIHPSLLYRALCLLPAGWVQRFRRLKQGAFHNVPPVEM